MLKLYILSGPNLAGQVISIGQETLLIGRDPPREGDVQALVLPDPERIISRLHARIEYKDGEYYLTDTSTNGVFINDASLPVGRGNKIQLHEGDILTIGDYRLQITAIGDKAVTAEGTSAAMPPLDIPPFWEKPAPSPKEEESEIKAPFELPDELFAGLEETPQPETPPGEIPPDLFAGLPVEEPFSPQALPEPPAPPHRGSDMEEGALMAFLQGAGLKGTIEPKDLPQDVYSLVGRLLRILVQGLMDLLRSRAQIKSELRLDMTIVGAAENNPLKFSVTVEDALVHLLKPSPGYLSSEEAVQEAVDDLVAHQVAMVAGMQAALKEVLERFDPEALETEAENLYPLLSHVPVQRQAKYWTLFKQRYADARRALEEDFQAIFGHLFAEAYERQAAALKRKRS